MLVAHHCCTKKLSCKNGKSMSHDSVRPTALTDRHAVFVFFIKSHSQPQFLGAAEDFRKLTCQLKTMLFLVYKTIIL